MTYKLHEHNAEAVKVALLNYDWLVRNRDARYFPDVETIVYGDGGVCVEALFNEGLTPATCPS